MKKNEWWKTGIIYQIYPMSFKDSNGDGVGDLIGIREKLDYLTRLGVTAIWLSPIYRSPMADFGYDISNYEEINPCFGSLRDFDQLLETCHQKKLKLILDFVPNHTSTEHPWFKDSRSSRNDPKREWYIWKDPKGDGGPPNNWLSNFGGSAWEWDPVTSQYYYHAFLKQQPDLNWRNPEVQNAMMDVLRFWLDRGVDGFRIDVIWHILKDKDFRDNPKNPAYTPGMVPYQEFFHEFSSDHPDVHDIIRKMREVLEPYGERLMIGEIYLPVERLVTYYGSEGSGLHLPFNFQLLTLPWNAGVIGKAIQEYEALLPSQGWPNWVLGNHDNSRIASRIGSQQARIAAMLLLTLRGTPTLYYGEELGMHDLAIDTHTVHDPLEKNVPGMGLGRDPERTPMQWNNALYAGFSTHAPWLPTANDYADINAEKEMADPSSVWALYHDLIEIRQTETALMTGVYRAVSHANDLLIYFREDAHKRFLVLLNFSAQPAQVPDIKGLHGKVILSTDPTRQKNVRLQAPLELKPAEGLLLESD